MVLLVAYIVAGLVTVFLSNALGWSAASPVWYDAVVLALWPVMWAGTLGVMVGHAVRGR